MQVIFISIILNVHNDPCFQDKLRSYFKISPGTLFRIKLYYNQVYKYTVMNMRYRSQVSCPTLS